MHKNNFSTLLSKVLGFVVFLISLTVIFGWLFSLENLTHPFTNSPVMRFYTAVCLSILSIGAFLTTYPLKILSRLISGLVFFFSIFVLLQYAFKIDFNSRNHFLNFFYSDLETFSGTKIAPNTGLSLLILSLSLFFQTMRKKTLVDWKVTFCTMITFSLSIKTLIEYLLHFSQNIYSLLYTDMSFLTVICVLILSISLFFASLSKVQSIHVLRFSLIPFSISCIFIAASLWSILDAARFEIILGFEPLNITSFSLFILVAILLGIGIYFSQHSLSYWEKTTESISIMEGQLKGKEELIRYIGHEIRNPLNVIINFAEPYLNLEKNEEIKEAFNIIFGAAYTLNQVVNDLLVASKTAIGKIELCYLSVELNAWAKKLFSLLSLLASQKKIKASLTLPDNFSGNINIDPTKVAQVITNLFSNALKHTKEGGEIGLNFSIKTDVNHHNTLRVDVKDNGEGIPFERQPELFKPFEQGRDIDSQLGYGLGLFICDSLIKKMNGHLFFESTPGKGSVFSFSINV